MMNKKIENRVVYMHTDSVFVTLKDYCDSTNIKQVCSDIQDYANEHLTEFCQKMLNVKVNKYLDLKQEIIARSALFLSKNRYALWIIDREGIPKDELEVKGIDVIKTNFPLAMQKLLKEIIIDILFDKTKDIIDAKLRGFKSTMKTFSFYDMAISTSVKGIEKYYDSVSRYKKGAPVHVKAAINHNIFLKSNDLTKKYQEIKSGDKIKYVYLKTNKYKFETIAFLEEVIDPLLQKFVEDHADYDQIFKSVLENKISTYYDAMGWSLVNLSVNTKNTFF